MDKQIETVALYYVIGLSLVLISIYAYYTYKAIYEGLKRDFSLFFIIISCIILSPFATYGFMISAQKKTEKVNVKYKDKENNIVETTLTTIIDEKIPKEKIIKITNINAYCQECQSNFIDNIYNCPKCGKKRFWYFLYAQNPHTSQKMHMSIEQWEKLPNDFIIKGLRKKKYPFCTK